MELIGKVVRLGNLVSGTSARGPWSKQELIVETDEQFPRQVCVICWTNLVEEAKALAPGQMVKIQISVESREFNGKWYTDVRAWRFDQVGATAAPAQPYAQQTQAQPMMHQTPPMPASMPDFPAPFQRLCTRRWMRFCAKRMPSTYSFMAVGILGVM